MDSPATGGLIAHLDGFVRAVRGAGIPVGITGAVDAAQVLTVVDLLDREQLRHGLAAVLLQRAAQRATYDVLFDLWWPLSDRPAVPVEVDGSTDTGPDDGVPDADRMAALAAELRAELLARLRDGDDEELRRFARLAVEQLGQGQPSPSGQSFFSYRVLRALSPDTLVAQLLAGLLGDAPRGGLDEQVARQTVRERLATFRAAVEAEVRRRSAAERGRDRVARTAVTPLADQVDFL
ncbi:MAG: Protein containing von Willebrand factor type domain CoxE-like, partial [Klenkia sp.]|nr:Protein containing von Willebrand factor type domain CoxE-like [Klenkia sp.]